MSIYTKTGDSGLTSIIGGKRVSKADNRLEAYGTLDELTAFEGALYNCLPNDNKYKEDLLWVINRTMDCSAILASDSDNYKNLPIITDDSVTNIEHIIDSMIQQVPPCTKFTLPIGSEALSRAHICRTICRRAEREIIRFNDNTDNKVGADLLKFINRLSDFFYAMGRFLVYSDNIEEYTWTPNIKSK